MTLKPMHRVPAILLRIAIALWMILPNARDDAWSAPGEQEQAPKATEQPQPAVGPTERASVSGLPIPRFVSLKSDRVNLRNGPSVDYPTSWVFRRAGLPVEVLNEFESWRQVRDSEGTTGWVAQSLLSGRRTALVAPWDAKAESHAEIAIRSSDSESSRKVALVEPGVIANLHRCDGRWCEVSVADYRGYLPQKQLWGIYEGEVMK